MPHWTLGLYDGKIRIREQDIAQSDKLLRKTLSHEYGHAILYLSYGGNIPLWLHEGFAQFNEPEQVLNAADKQFLIAAIKRYGEFSLEDLEAMFAQKTNEDVVRLAYLESRIFVDYLMEKYRKYKLKRLLQELKERKQWQQALTEVYNRNIQRLNEEFNEYLDRLLS